MDDEHLPRQEYCNDCGELVTAEDEGSFNFYCDCGNEWVEGGQEKEEKEEDEDEDED